MDQASCAGAAREGDGEHEATASVQLPQCESACNAGQAGAHTTQAKPVVWPPHEREYDCESSRADNNAESAPTSDARRLQIEPVMTPRARDCEQDCESAHASHNVESVRAQTKNTATHESPPGRRCGSLACRVGVV